MRRGPVLLGLALLVLGGVGYVGGFLYGLQFAYSDTDGPGWFDVLFPVSLAAGGLGALVLIVGLVFGRKQAG